MLEKKVCYRLVHDVFVDEDSPTSSKSDPETDCDIAMAPEVVASGTAAAADGEESRAPSQASETTFPALWAGGERRRRKLPEIPKNKKCM